MCHTRRRSLEYTVSFAVAERQACYDGALRAKGIHSLPSYGQDEAVHDNNAYPITSTYRAGALMIYAIHPTQPTSSGSRHEYHMTLGLF